MSYRVSCCRVTFGAMLLAVAFGVSLSANPAHAQKVDYDHIINLADKQRMITQRIGKETLLLAMGIKKDERREQLRELHAVFEQTFKGLRDGDETLRLPGTTNPKTLEDIAHIEDLWTICDAALKDAMAGGELSRANAAVVADLSVPLLEATDKAVQDYKKEASAGGLFSVLAVAIDISGRQRTLSQKMAKEFLLIALDHEAD